MSSLSLYEHYHSVNSDKREVRQVTIVLHEDFQDHEILARTMARHLRKGPAPDRVVLFGMDSHAAFIQQALASNSAFRARLDVAWGAAAENHQCFAIVRKHGDVPYESFGLQLTFEEIHKEVQQAAAMTAQNIFSESGCLQVAPRGSHYSKTSKAHCDTFIRASNALVKSSHTLTIAYFLQPFVTQMAKRILVDTSAIASVVYAACHIAIRSGALSVMPIIDSFQSYSGLSDDDLEDVENTLFVISASTSGNLARAAFNRGVKRHQLMTLYLLSQDQADQDALCLLRKHSGNPHGLNLLQSWLETECKLCRTGSVPIQIGGDLFLTSLPETISVVLLKKHLPDDQRDIISLFAGHRAFRIHRRIGDRTAEISVDLESVFLNSEKDPLITIFNDEWQRLLRRYLPANVSHVVYPDYPYALTLAEGVNSFISQFVKPNFKVTSGGDLINSSTVPNGCAIVVTPCVDEPVELMGINRDLRSKIPGGTATYMFPILRAQSEAQAKTIVTNLTFGDRGAGTYSLHRMYEIYLPEDRDINPWERELACLKSLSDWLEEEGKEVPAQLVNRRSQLNSATVAGLTDNLFWPDSTGKSLSIRSNFVLLPTQDGKRQLDQADIFVVMSALLNNLRQLDGGSGLRSNQHQRKVLSPGNFLRFNDGVIQAAILRAARKGELNYAATENGKDSAAMADHILKMVDKAASEDGEALSEFVLAMATGILRLETRDREWVVKTIIDKDNTMPLIVALMARAIDSGVLPPN